MQNTNRDTLRSGWHMTMFRLNVPRPSSLLTWRYKQYVTPKHQSVPTRQHGVTSQQMVVFDSRTPDLEQERAQSSVHGLSVRMKQRGSHWTEFDKTWYLNFSRKSNEKIQVSFKSDKNTGYFQWRRFHVYDNISLNSSSNEKCFK